MSHLPDLLRLLQIPQLGAQRIGKLLEYVDLDTFCQYDKVQLRYIGWNEKQIQRWFQPERKWIDTALTWAERSPNRLVSILDPDYPFLLKQISSAPPVLFVKGNIAALSSPQIAMVGSRDYSDYGKYWAEYFARAFVEHGLTVTSGLAIGIDGFCHQQAVAHHGTTIAVLGSGLEQVYPARHKKLAAAIIENGGALLSEFFPHQPPLAENFPRRNRIISGLSLGTLVVEATLNSGSLITARYALEQGREVSALPNAIHTPYSQGCHKLIKEGALLVDCVEDVLDAIALQHQPKQSSLFELSKIQAVCSAPKFAKNPPNLTACQQAIIEKITFEPICIDDIANACQMAVNELLIELLELELLDVVKQVDGGYIRS